MYHPAKDNHPPAPNWEMTDSHVRVDHYPSKTINADKLIVDVERCSHCHEVCHYDYDIDRDGIDSYYLCNCSVAKDVAELESDIHNLESDIFTMKRRLELLKSNQEKDPDNRKKKVAIEAAILLRTNGLDEPADKF